MNQKGSRKRQRHLIIGNSAAALSAVKAIRENDSNSRITLISAENHYAYAPVLLTYYVSQRITREKAFLADRNFYKDYGVNLLLGNKATKIDPDDQLVFLADGKAVHYDKLLVATGSTPKRLGVEGENLEGVFTLKTMDDGDKLVKHSSYANEVVIIGGGLIGLQAANALFRESRKIIIVIGSKQALSQNVDSSCAENVCQGIRECGMSILFETNATSIGEKNNQLYVELNSGKSLRADAVIIGKGVSPNIQLVQESDIQVNKGIIVDETMRTNIPNVFAAGDVAEGTHLITGEKQVIATWPNACSQGKTAGTNMTGGKARFFGLNGNICSFLGKTVASVGITKAENGDLEEISYIDPVKSLYRKMVWNKRDEIVGAVLMGKVEDIGVITNLIKSRAKIPKERRAPMVRSTVRYGEFFSQKTGYCLW